MKQLLQQRFWMTVSVITVLVIAGCFFPIEVNQPSSATVGETIKVSLGVQIDETESGAGAGPSSGLCAILIDTNWTVEKVEFDGDYGPEVMEYLHPDSADNSPGKGVDFWYDSLAFHLPPPAGMEWVVFQGIEEHFYIGDTSNVTVEISIKVNTAGVVNLGYFVSTTDLSFEEDDYYAYSLDHEISVVVDAVEDNIPSGIIEAYGLEQNYPNPFNPSTTIRYQLASAGDVHLSVYDITGKEIAVLVNGSQNAGEHRIEFSGENLSSGVYLYRLTAGDQTFMKKMMLVK